MGPAVKHTVPDRVKPSFVIFDIWALWHSGLGAELPAVSMGRTPGGNGVEAKSPETESFSYSSV